MWADIARTTPHVKVCNRSVSCLDRSPEVGGAAGATRGWLIRCPRAANLPYVRLRLKKNIFTPTRVTQDLYNASYTPTSDFLSGVFAPRAPSSTYCEVLYPQVTPHAGMVPGVTSDVLVSRAGSTPGRRGVVVRRCELEL